MSQISVVHYSPPLNKINVLQQNNVSNKQGDRQIIVLHKQRQILPQPDKDKDDVVAVANNAKKKAKSEKEMKTNPLPISVARRNARERNRVKLVNDGFANLREHIPSFIAAAFESTSGRGGNKKLSKVETLRMAVEYIRTLEEILGTDTDGNEVTQPMSDSAFPSPSSSTSSHLNPTQIAYTYQVLSPPAEDDEVCPSPRHFIRINPNQNSYQIIPAGIYEDGENMDPMVVDGSLLADPNLLDSNLGFSVNSQDLSYLSSMHTTCSLSPGIYSDSSLSSIADVKSDPNCYVTVYNTPPEERPSPNYVNVKTEEVDMPVISLKTESELPDEHKENIADVLQWWEQQPQDVGR